MEGWVFLTIAPVIALGLFGAYITYSSTQRSKKIAEERIELQRLYRELQAQEASKPAEKGYENMLAIGEPVSTGAKRYRSAVVKRVGEVSIQILDLGSGKFAVGPGHHLPGGFLPPDEERSFIRGYTWSKR